MKNLLHRVRKATQSIGKSPYDDKKTEEIIKESTDKLLEHYKTVIKTNNDMKPEKD